MKTLSFNTFFRKGFWSLVLIMFTFGLNAQTNISLVSDADPNTPMQSNCVEIQLGTSITFNTTTSCGLNIDVLYFEEGKPFGPIPDSVFEKTTNPFTHEFTLLGSYIFICDVAPFPVNDVADICFTVVAEPIPALGEWALIILFLLITIIGVVGIKTYSSDAISDLSQRQINKAKVA